MATTWTYRWTEIISGRVIALDRLGVDYCELRFDGELVIRTDTQYDGMETPSFGEIRIPNPTRRDMHDAARLLRIELKQPAE